MSTRFNQCLLNIRENAIVLPTKFRKYYGVRLPFRLRTFFKWELFYSSVCFSGILLGYCFGGEQHLERCVICNTCYAELVHSLE